MILAGATSFDTSPFIRTPSLENYVLRVKLTRVALTLRHIKLDSVSYGDESLCKSNKLAWWRVPFRFKPKGVIKQTTCYTKRYTTQHSTHVLKIGEHNQVKPVN